MSLVSIFQMNQPSLGSKVAIVLIFLPNNFVLQFILFSLGMNFISVDLVLIISAKAYCWVESIIILDTALFFQHCLIYSFLMKKLVVLRWEYFRHLSDLHTFCGYTGFNGNQFQIGCHVDTNDLDLTESLEFTVNLVGKIPFAGTCLRSNYNSVVLMNI